MPQGLGSYFENDVLVNVPRMVFILSTLFFPKPFATVGYIPDIKRQCPL